MEEEGQQVDPDFEIWEQMVGTFEPYLPPNFPLHLDGVCPYRIRIWWASDLHVKLVPNEPWH